MSRQAVVNCGHVNALAVADHELRLCRELSARFDDHAATGSRAFCSRCRVFGLLEADGRVTLTRAAPPRPFINANDFGPQIQQRERRVNGITGLRDYARR